MQPPVPVEDLIRAPGIELRFPDLGSDVSGVLVRQPEGMVIGVNRRHAKTRQRFTAAHELGHAVALPLERRIVSVARFSAVWNETFRPRYSRLCGRE
jgi:Zn-dependent peptidase ImmA (M78 family)